MPGLKPRRYKSTKRRGNAGCADPEFYPLAWASFLNRALDEAHFLRRGRTLCVRPPRYADSASEGLAGGSRDGWPCQAANASRTRLKIVRRF